MWCRGRPHQGHVLRRTGGRGHITRRAAENDLAVLQASKIPGRPDAATMRSTADLAPGDQVVAVGFPFGIGPSTSAGVVSGLKRSVPLARGQAGDEQPDPVRRAAANRATRAVRWSRWTGRWWASSPPSSTRPAPHLHRHRLRRAHRETRPARSACPVLPRTTDRPERGKPAPPWRKAAMDNSTNQQRPAAELMEQIPTRSSASSSARTAS